MSSGGKSKRKGKPTKVMQSYNQALPLILESPPGRPDLMQVRIDSFAAQPHNALFVDYCSVKKARDGVQLFFGKLHPFKDSFCLNAIEISFPWSSFYNQLFKSIHTTENKDRCFRESVLRNVERFKYDRINAINEVEDGDKIAVARSNFVYMAIHQDDTSIDFYHLDANTLSSAIIAFRSGETIPIDDDFQGIIRIVMSPSLLLFFLDECIRLAEELKRTNPGIDVDEGQV